MNKKVIAIIGLIIAIVIIGSFSFINDVERMNFEGFSIEVPKDTNFEEVGDKYIDMNEKVNVSIQINPIAADLILNSTKENVDVYDFNDGEIVIFDSSNGEYDGYFIKENQVLNIKGENKETIKTMLESIEFR